MLNDQSLDDILWGAEEIAAFIKRTQRQTYYLLDGKKLPAKKLGHIWVGSKAKLRKHLLGDGEAA